MTSGSTGRVLVEDISDLLRVTPTVVVLRAVVKETVEGVEVPNGVVVDLTVDEEDGGVLKVFDSRLIEDKTENLGR